MSKFDSLRTMEQSIRATGKPSWQCEDCGRIFSTLEQLENASCSAKRSPYGWGKCRCSNSAKVIGEVQEEILRRRPALSPQQCKQLNMIKSTDNAFRDKYVGKKFENLLMSDITHDIYLSRLYRRDRYEYHLCAPGQMIEVAIDSAIFEVKNKQKQSELPAENLSYYIDLLEKNINLDGFWIASEVIASMGHMLSNKTDDEIKIENSNLVNINNSLIVPILNGGDQAKKVLEVLCNSLLNFIKAFDNNDRWAQLYNKSWRDTVKQIYDSGIIEDTAFWDCWYALLRLPIEISLFGQDD